jgi:dTDP-4-amino-4,6-dideoxygalactose transaminase
MTSKPISEPAVDTLFESISPKKIPLPVGQMNWPSWGEYVEIFEGIFNRGYYTNHGPLVQELEVKLSSYLKVKHVVCVSNATIGLIMGVEALQLTGKVITPSFTFIASTQALTWSGVEPVFCDVNVRTHQIDLSEIDKLITPDVSGILAVNLWGGSCNPQLIEEIAQKKGLKVIFDSAHAMGCEFNGRPIGNFGDLEVFSFHATKIFSTGEGGCITTNNDEIARKLRNIRSSYGAGETVRVVKTSNGRMSEAQAAVGLMNLRHLNGYIDRNRESFELYRELLKKIEGISIYLPSDISKTNFQYIVCEIDEKIFGISRDELCRKLISKNIISRKYFNPGSHMSPPYIDLPQYKNLSLKNTKFLNDRLLILPCGSLLEKGDIEYICGLIEATKSDNRMV